MKSLASSLVALLFLVSAAAFADRDVGISSPWWNPEYVQVNPGADDGTQPAPQPTPDTDKDKS
jgi:hypothetical protein